MRYIYTCICRLVVSDLWHHQAAALLALLKRLGAAHRHGCVDVKRLEDEIGNRRVLRLIEHVYVDGCSPWGLPGGDCQQSKAGDPHPCRATAVDQSPLGSPAPQQTATPIVSSSCELPISNAPHIPPPSTVLLNKSTPSTVVRLHETNNNPRPDIWSLLSSITTPPRATTVSKLPHRSYPRTPSSQDGRCSSTRRLLQPG